MPEQTSIVKMRNVVVRITVERDANGNVIGGKAVNIPSPAKEVVVPDRVVERGK
jgi:hypothetical protein